MTGPTTPKQNGSDIGPYYKGVGIAVIVMLAGLLGFEIYRGNALTMVHLGIAITLVFLFMLAVRSDKFDNAFKSIIDALPFTKYKKPE